MGENRSDFSKGSISKNILSLALPMTAAQLVNVLYSVVDRIYLGRLPGSSHLALTGLGVTIPIVSIIMGFANLCGTGGGPIFSICRGQGDREEAERVMGNSFSLLLVLGTICTAFFLIFKRPILYLFGASDATFPYADDYMTIYLMGTLFVMISLGMNPFVNAQGFGSVGMMTVVLGAAVNIVLDPIFIFLLDMGVKGAALATVISQGISAAWVLKFLTGKKVTLRIRKEAMQIEWKRVRAIMALGVSGFMMQFTNGLVQIFCNATLQIYGGDIYVGVMTVLNSVRDIATMMVHGLTNGASPVMSFNYGEKAYDKVKKAIKFVTVVCFSYALFVWGIIKIAPEFFIRIFNSEPALLEKGVPALHIYFFGFCFMALQFTGQCVFVALGKAKRATFFSIFRKVIIVVPLTVLLPRIGGLGVDGVFWAEPISNLVGGSACFFTMLLTILPELKQKQN